MACALPPGVDDGDVALFGNVRCSMCGEEPCRCDVLDDKVEERRLHRGDS